MVCIVLGAVQALGSSPLVYYQYMRRRRVVAARVAGLGVGFSGLYFCLLGIGFTQLDVALTRGLRWFAIALACASVGILLLLGIGVWQFIRAARRPQNGHAHENQ